MSNNTSSNKAAVPEAKGALNRFKFEVAMNWVCRLQTDIRKPYFQTEWQRRWLIWSRK